MFVWLLAVPRRSAGLQLLHHHLGSMESTERATVAARYPRAAPDFPSLIDEGARLLRIVLCSRRAIQEGRVVCAKPELESLYQ